MKKIYPLLIIALFAAQFLFINPVGEFALNDDWVHTDTILHWMQTGEFRLSPFLGPTLYVPILYGAALVKTFGFSYTLLRASNLAFALGTLLLFYALALRITKKETLSFFATLALWLNPIFYNLSFTFMSDIPALFFVVASLLCYWRGFSENRPSFLFWGSMLSIAGAYTRQTGILVFTASGIYALIHIKNIGLKQLLKTFGIPAVIGAGVYWYLLIADLLPKGAGLHIIGTTNALAKHAAQWVLYTLVYIGLAVLPLFAGWALALKNWKKNTRLLFFVIAAPAALALYLSLAHNMQLPYVLNVIHEYGLGPMKQSLNGIVAPLAPRWAWILTTTISAAAGGWMLYALSRRTQKNHLGFIGIYAALYTAFLLLFDGFDRYFLPLFATALILLLDKIKHSRLSSSGIFVVLIFFTLWSVSQTHFYLNWNRVRWDMTSDTLAQTGLAPYEIDGGYEWNGMHSYWSAVESGFPHGTWDSPWWIRRLFVNNTEEYIVSFTPNRPTHETASFREVEGFNPNKKIYLLKKIRQEE